MKITDDEIFSALHQGKKIACGVINTKCGWVVIKDKVDDLLSLFNEKEKRMTNLPTDYSILSAKDWEIIE